MAESVVYRGGRVNLRIPEARNFEAQAIERGLGQVQQAVDRMTSFFSKQNRIQQELKGEQYGATNAPTIEQIEDAAASGQELTLPGGDETIFARAARQAAASVVGEEIELAARREIDSVLIDYQTNNRNPADLSEKFDAIIEGYSSTFDESVPSQARKLRAGLSIVANSKLTSYQNNYIVKARADAKSAFIQSTVLELDSLDEVLPSLPTEDAKGNPLNPDAVLQAYKNNVLAEAVRNNFSTSEIKSLATLFDNKVIETARKTLLNSLFSDDPKTGNFTDKIIDIGRGETSSLTTEELNSVRILQGAGQTNVDIAKVLRAERNAFINLIEAEEKFIDRNDADFRDKLVAKANAALVLGNKSDFKQAIEILKKYDSDKAQELQEKFFEAGEIRTVSDPYATRFLFSRRDRLTIEEVIDSRELLSLKDRKKYFDKVKDLDDADLQYAKKIIKGELKLPDNFDLLEESDANLNKVAIFARAEARLEELRREAGMNDEDFDPDIAAAKVLEETASGFEDITNNRIITSAKTSLQVLKANILSYKINEKFDPSELEDNDFSIAAKILKEIMDDESRATKKFRARFANAAPEFINIFNKADGLTSND